MGKLSLNKISIARVCLAPSKIISIGHVILIEDQEINVLTSDF
jgi:hypothetical protein